MRKHTAKYLLAVALLLLSAAGWSQMKVYTRSVKLQDFRSKTVKVVLDGPDDFNTALREEMVSRWCISPFELCSAADYKKIKTSNDYYFLHLEKKEGIMFLTLAKGGKENETDPLKEGFLLAEVPVYGEKDNSGSNLEYMDAIVDIIQNFISKVLRNESSTYKGIKSSVSKAGKDAQKVILDIKPDPESDSGPRYRLIFDAGTHALYYYGRHSK